MNTPSHKLRRPVDQRTKHVLRVDEMTFKRARKLRAADVAKALAQAPPSNLDRLRDWIWKWDCQRAELSGPDAVPAWPMIWHNDMCTGNPKLLGRVQNPDKPNYCRFYVYAEEPKLDDAGNNLFQEGRPMMQRVSFQFLDETSFAPVINKLPGPIADFLHGVVSSWTPELERLVSKPPDRQQVSVSDCDPYDDDLDASD